MEIQRDNIFFLSSYLIKVSRDLNECIFCQLKLSEMKREYYYIQMTQAREEEKQQQTGTEDLFSLLCWP